MEQEPEIAVDIEKIQEEIRMSIMRRPDYGTFDKEGTSFMRTVLTEEAGIVSRLTAMSVLTNQAWEIIPLTAPGGGNPITRRMKRFVMKYFGWPARRYAKTQTDCNGHIIRELNEMVTLMNKLTMRIETQNEKIIAQESEIASLAGTLRRCLADYTTKSQTIYDKVEEHTVQIDACHQETADTRDRIHSLRESMDALSRQIEAPQDFDYAGFEDRYRGSEENILDLLKTRYLPHFLTCKRVVDLGCGRGEFLSVLKGSGIDSFGVDMDADMIARCAVRGLTVEKGNAIDYISSANAGEVDGIMCSQVVEHISSQDLIRLVNGAYNVLPQGGMLAIETINPLSLSAYRFSYPMDITHRRFVHPFTLKFLLESVGFSKVELCFYSVAREPISFTGKTPEDVAAFLNDVQNALFGEQDYAVIAEK